MKGFDVGFFGHLEQVYGPKNPEIFQPYFVSCIFHIMPSFVVVKDDLGVENYMVQHCFHDRIFHPSNSFIYFIFGNVLSTWKCDFNVEISLR